MNDSIDLTTLAALGHHFSSVEESSELKTLLLNVHNEVEVIKSFLSKQYGQAFTSLFEGANDNQNQKGRLVSSTATSLSSSSVISKGRQLQSMKPPPLQRLNSSTSSSRNSTSLKVIPEAVISPPQLSQRFNSGTKVTKETKFHRNFLSLSSSNKNKGNTSNQKAPNLSISKVGSVRNLSLKQNKFLPPLILRRQEHKFVLEEEAGDVENYEGVKQVAEYYSDNPNLIVEPQYEEEYYEEPQQFGEDSELMEGGNDGSVIGYNQGGMNLDTIEYEYAADEDRNYGMDNEQVEYQQQEATKIVTAKQKRRVSYPIMTSSSTFVGISPTDENEADPSFHKKCKICHEEIPSFNLFNHVVATHYNGEVPTCKVCKKTFTYKQGLISHMRYHDAGKYDKACSYCGKRFIRRSDVVIHERRLHTGERPYKCPVPQCNHGFVRRYCLLTHVKTNHGEPYFSQIVAQSASNRRKSN